MTIIIALVAWLFICVMITGSSGAGTWILFFCGIIGLVISAVSKSKTDENNSKEPTINRKAPTPLKRTKLQERLDEYKKLFSNCCSVDEIIEKYMTDSSVENILSISEIRLLKHYLQFNSQFKSHTWTQDDLLNRIRLTYKTKKNTSDTSQDNNTSITAQLTSDTAIINYEVDCQKSSTSLPQSRIQQKLRLYKTIFEDYTSLDSVIEKYIELAGNDMFSAIEVKMMKNYLQYYSNFKNQVWSDEVVISKIKNKLNEILTQNKPAEKSIFASFTTSETNASTYRAEIIKEKKHPYSMFEQMRSNTAKNGRYFSTEDEFVIHGKLMESFEDSFEQIIPFHEYSPTYSIMNDDQLRTYFTWRTKLRNGEIFKVPLSYVFVYIYELINNIGVKSPEDGLQKLVLLLKNCSNIEPKIEDYLTEWIKDYYICNEIKPLFKDIVKQNELEHYYPSVVLDEDDCKYTFQNLCNVSKYKIEGSKFFTDENKKLIEQSFEQIVVNLKLLFSNYGTSLSELLSGSSEYPSWWSPFSNAVYKQAKIADKRVIITNREWYEFKDMYWHVYKPSGNNASAGHLIGYIIKRTESTLRNLTKFKYRLSPDVLTLANDLQTSYTVPRNMRTAILDPMFNEIIDATTSRVYSLFIENEEMDDTIDVACKKLKEQLGTEPYATIIKMRALDSIKAECNQGKSFCEQAKILVNLTDNIDNYLSFSDYTYSFDLLTNEQIRCYVSWRSKIKESIFPEVEASYIQLYILELINNIAEENIDVVIFKLATILKHYGHTNRSLTNTLLSHIKDYFICNDFADTFYEMICNFDIAIFYPKIAIEYADKFNPLYYQQISNYKIENSRFYNEQNAPIINGCFEFLFNIIEQFFKEKNLNLKSIIIGTGYAKNWWSPFANTYYCAKPVTQKKIVISSNEKYSYKKQEWTCDIKPAKDNTGAMLLGYILKRMEVSIRSIMKFKYKLSVDISSIDTKLNNIKIISVLQDGMLDKAIDDAVNEYFISKHPCVFDDPSLLFEKNIEIKIDKSKLDRIRDESNIIQDKLKIDNDINMPTIDDLLSDIISISNALEKSTLTTNEYISQGKYSLSVVLRSFGSWSAAILQAGLQNTRSENVVNIPQNEFIDDLIRVSQLLVKDSVTRDEYTQHGKYSISSVIKRVGSWSLAVEKAGLKDLNSIPSVDIPEEIYICDILKVANQIGYEEVFESEYHQYGNYSTKAIKSRFGSWQIAAKKAGVFVDKDKLSEKRPNLDELQNVEIIVKIDKSKLDGIRSEANVIRDRLIVEDDIEEQDFIDIGVALVRPEVTTSNSAMEAFYVRLSDVQREVLSVIANSSSCINQVIELSQKNRIMPEILIEGINELALEAIGDNIIDATNEHPFIYEDYIDDIKNILEGDA